MITQKDICKLTYLFENVDKQLPCVNVWWSFDDPGNIEVEYWSTTEENGTAVVFEENKIDGTVIKSNKLSNHLKKLLLPYKDFFITSGFCNNDSCEVLNAFDQYDGYSGFIHDILTMLDITGGIHLLRVTMWFVEDPHYISNPEIEDNDYEFAIDALSQYNQETKSTSFPESGDLAIKIERL